MVKKKDEIPDWVTDEIQNAKFEKPSCIDLPSFLGGWTKVNLYVNSSSTASLSL